MSQALSPTGRRKAVEQWPVTVSAVQDVTEFVRRVTFTAEQLGSYVRCGWDEYFGLLIPRLEDDARPALRWYSMRSLRTSDQEMDVDIVLHGDDGPGTAWVSRCQPGDQLPLRVGGADYLTLPAADESHLFVADETSLPALAAIADEYVATGAVGQVIAVVETPDLEHATTIHPDFPVTHLLRGARKPGSEAIGYVESMTLPPLDFAWLCGESRLATSLRRHLTKARGVDRKAIAFSGYWRA